MRFVNMGTNHFNEDLKLFFKQDNTGINPAIVRAAMQYDDALKSVCADPEHLAAHPKMLRMCCPPLKKVPKDASPELIAAVREQVDHCYRAHVGLGFDQKSNEADRQRAMYETEKQQKIVDVVTREACKNAYFAKNHTDVCCVSLGVNLGYTGDSQAVARACGLAQL